LAASGVTGMYHPSEIDGCSLVVLRPTALGFEIIESGILSYDGEALRLETLPNGWRLIDDAESNEFRYVGPENRIPECQGFDLFVILPAR
jgi:hypothetical protein